MAYVEPPYSLQISRPTQPRWSECDIAQTEADAIAAYDRYVARYPTCRFRVVFERGVIHPPKKAR